MRNEPNTERPRTRSYTPNIDRPLPSAADAEKGILSAITVAPSESMPKVRASGITKDHIFIPAHRAIFEAMLELEAGGKSGNMNAGIGGVMTCGDFIILTQYLRDKGILDECGGAAFITELYTDDRSHVHNLDEYIRIVREKYVSRLAITLMLQNTAEAYDDPADVEGIVKRAQQFAAKVSDAQNQRKQRKTNAQEIRELLEDFDNGDKIKLFGTPLGIKPIDAEIWGLQSTDLLLIAAPTSGGKSALAGQIEFYWARTGKRVLDFTFEMTRRQKLQRWIQLSSGRNFRDEFKERQLELGATTIPRDDIQKAADEMMTLPIEVLDDKELASIEAIASESRRMHAQTPLGLVVIDFDALVKGVRHRGDTNEMELASIAYGAKGIATELRCPVILLSQVTIDDKTGKVKSRGSEAKLFAANVALYIEITEDEKRPNIHIWKQRDGKRGKIIPMGFTGNTGYFFEVDESEAAESVKPKINPRRK